MNKNNQYKDYIFAENYTKIPPKPNPNPNFKPPSYTNPKPNANSKPKGK